ncbi:SusC/RagA family TonB-linked outer membrane protein [Paraprevotella clara]|uniref:SusC/RagA family TonB-linked outer membrane protein n=1 Tax=Paraprevotella clara TaxID=454154 RepID=UPI0032C1D18B
MNKIKFILLMAVLFCSGMASAQSGAIVTGKVYADDEPDGFIGATVIEMDKNGRIYSSALTDFNGNFSLKIKNPANKLNFSYVGYKKKSLPIGTKRRFDVKLEMENVMSEVTVKASKMISGSGGLSIPEREYSGAMQKFDTKALEGMSVPSIDDALQGRIAGLDIVANSGDLGSGTVMRIRGITSINGNTQPLILMNGVPFESNLDGFDFASADQEKFAQLLSISPDDIAEIAVLKDGAACAIWGARGANGVIDIKTKQGVTGPTRVNYTYRFSGHMQPTGTELLSGDKFTPMLKEAYRNRNNVESNIPELSYMEDMFLTTYGTAQDYPNYINNTDWVDEVTQFGVTHDHTLAISGGGDKAKFRVSLGYYNQTGTVIGQELTRFSNRMNLDYSVSSRLKFYAEFAMTYTDNDKNYTDDDYGQDNFLNIARKRMPNMSVYRKTASGEDTDVFFNMAQNSLLLTTFGGDLPDGGTYAMNRNPVGFAELATNKQKNMRIMPTLRLQYDMLDPTGDAKLRYSGYVKFDSENNRDERFLPRELTSKNWNDDDVNKSYSREQEALSIYTDHNITWQPKLKDYHSVTLYGSWQMDIYRSRYQEFQRSGLASTSATDVSNLGRNINKFASSRGEGRNMAFLLQGHYILLDRYILDASARWDGSSRFGTANRWGLFPSVSAKWLIHEEKFMKPTENWLSELALRLSWGGTGNKPGKEYLYYSKYSNFSTGYLDMSAIKPENLQLTNLKWERTSAYNLGVDVSLFNYKYHLVANVYHRHTEDLLFENPGIPSSTGFGSVEYINAGTMDNDGWELEFSTNNMVKKGDWSLDLTLNFSNNRNTIKEMNEMVLNAWNKDFDHKNGSYLKRIQIENAMGSIYGFKCLGVYQYDTYQPNNPSATAPIVRDANGNAVLDAQGNTIPMYFAYGAENYKFRGGDAIYEDVNHDGTIDELDIVYLGNSNPKFDGGFGATLRWKRFTLNAFFNYRVGGKVINMGRMNAENMYYPYNQSVAVNWRWRKDGDLTEIPRALYNAGYNWLGSDRFVEDGSFLRFKQLTLTYSFDPKLLKRAHLDMLNLSFTMNNLFTVTKYTGADPEISPALSGDYVGISADSNRTPRSRYFTFSLTVGI